MMFLLLFWLVSLLSSLAVAQQSLFPATVPLAVRSPYLNTWLNSEKGSKPLSDSWPNFWVTNGQVTAWLGHVRVDGVPFQFMGTPTPTDGRQLCTVTNVEITPTRSIFTMQAGPMDITVTFLTPIDLSDRVRQSIPFSYLTLEAVTNDGLAHSVQVYTDVSGEWLSGARDSPIRWSTTLGGDVVFHKIELQQPTAMAENANQTQDGVLYYGLPNRAGLTYQTGGDAATRSQFLRTGVLTNTLSTAFAPIAPVFSVFAMSIDLGTVVKTAAPLTWTIGLVRNPVVLMTTSTGAVQQRSPYWASEHENADELVRVVLDDYPAAMNRSVALDRKIIQAASNISTEYADLVSLTARQIVAATDITISKARDGSWNMSDVKTFMKDIGTSGRVNPVERLYAAFPAFLYLEPLFAGTLLEPLLESQDVPKSQPFAAPDLGSSYPIAISNLLPHSQGIEQTGNMLIMVYAHALKSSDGRLFVKHYPLLKKWADYLSNNTLIPEQQLSADGQGFANMTNLAIKGIIGVRAMAEISRVSGHGDDAARYEKRATALLQSWQSLALSADQTRLLGIYRQETSSALMYNLYADQLLELNMVNPTILASQARFYQNELANAGSFGLPIDSNTGFQGSSAWSLFTAGTIADVSTRNQLIASVRARASFNSTRGGFPTDYDVITGAIQSGIASPGQGAMFSLLALSLPGQNIDTAFGSDNSAARAAAKKRAGIIAGIVLGVVGLIAICVGFFLFYRKRRRDRETAYPGPEMGTFSDTTTVERAFVPNRRDSASMYGTMTVRTASSSKDFGDPVLFSPPPVPTKDHMQWEMMQPWRPSPPQSEVSLSRYASTRAPPSSVGESDFVSPTEVNGLRNEVENLRRIMEAIREERMEPPPGYIEEPGTPRPPPPPPPRI